MANVIDFKHKQKELLIAKWTEQYKMYYAWYWIPQQQQKAKAN